MTLQIEQTEVESVTYYTTQVRGINYTLHNTGSEWELHSRRQALGKNNVGSYKFFPSLQALEKQIKAFNGVSQLIN